MSIKFCKRCVMPDTRPGITFDAQGVCRPCRIAEERDKIDWEARWQELVELTDQFRGKGDYDCIVTGSGGKDSHYQVYVMKELLGMRPLLLNVNNYSWTPTGWHNLMNWSETFNCDMISLTLRRKAARTMTRLAFERYGTPTWYWDRAVYAWPIQMALKLKIPLVVYGENISYEYGGAQKESPLAYEQINNEAVKPLDIKEWLDFGMNADDFIPLQYPDPEKVKAKLTPIYLSYFLRWSGYDNMQLAKRHGFRTLEAEGWNREGFIENYDQIDTAGYLVHPWLKWPKFQHSRVSDILSLWIRAGFVDRRTAVGLVKKQEGILDQKVLEDFLAWAGYTDTEFWTIVDKFYNPELFHKVKGLWKPIKEIE